jgi:uncharacterized protein YacL
VTDKLVQAVRNVFVFALLFVGGFAGFQGGEQASDWLNAKTANSNDPFYQAYNAVLSGNQGRLSVIASFTLLGILVAFLFASGLFSRLIRTGEQLRAMKTSEKLSTVVGVVLGLLITLMLYPILVHLLGNLGGWVTVLVGIMLVYLGIVIASSMKEDLWGRVSLSGGDEVTVQQERCKILDTNVIIDGRVADICRTGFLEGPIYVPGFVLDELQHIADSSDGLKRARGRRGLDILNQMRTELKMMVRTYDNTDPNDRDEVDSKLVKLAKELNGVIVTNDFNLNKVAELQGVKVLNINELANALKPVVLPGEEMTVTIIKEGKEINQGVAYLDDGTMIVVEGARRHIGETLDVVTSSVLQTVAGKMIFASIRNPGGEGNEEDDGYDRHLRSYPRSGPRRKIQH